MAYAMIIMVPSGGLPVTFVMDGEELARFDSVVDAERGYNSAFEVIITTYDLANEMRKAWPEMGSESDEMHLHTLRVCATKTLGRAKTFFEWRDGHGLKNAEAAAMLGVSPGTVANVSNKGGVSATWDAFARVAENAPLAIRFADIDGQPVAYFGGDKRAYTPPNVIRGDGRIAAHVVLLWASMRLLRTDGEYQAARRYLSYWPEGPQLR